MRNLVKAVNVKGLAHITGGGLIENIPRVLPKGFAAQVQRGSWDMPPLFTWLKKQGNVSEREMYRVFNCGIGMVAVVSPDEAEKAEALLAEAGETVWRIGTVRCRRGNGPRTVIA